MHIFALLIIKFLYLEVAKMLARVMGFFGRSGRQLAGVDKAGNSYFREPQSANGSVVERRWVEFRNSQIVAPIPVEWNSWLNGRRKEAPSPEEMMELEARRSAVKIKAALLEQEEEKSRYRAKALQQGMNEDDMSPRTMTRYLQQVTGGNVPGKGEEKATMDSSFRPEKWNPEAKERPAEPQGAGDTFKPGTWKPGP